MKKDLSGSVENLYMLGQLSSDLFYLSSVEENEVIVMTLEKWVDTLHSVKSRESASPLKSEGLL